MSKKPTIPSWSYSRLLDFESCRRRIYFKAIKRYPDPSGPAALRGTQIHTDCENYVLGQSDITPEMEKFKPEFEALRAAYQSGTVSLEGEWAMDKEWAPTEWKAKNAWVRMKLDACVFRNKKQSHVVVIDYKSGRKFGNEVKHTEQGQLYSLGVVMRYPRVEIIDVEFWYLDQDDMLDVRYERAEALDFLAPFTRRGTLLTNATDFPPNPNIFTCKFCPYRPSQGGQCAVGVG